ncbi:hypothetical protein AGMMS49975_14620 [Clostridia bacterium]|nr:hypothetical protein AGMMS49975_14620 [Clostridia bacterium]
MGINDRLRVVISENLLKQKELADILGVTDSYISFLLKRENSKPSKMFLSLLEEKLGYNPDWIVNGTEPKMSKTYNEYDKMDIQQRILKRLEYMPIEHIQAVVAFLDSLETVNSILTGAVNDKRY